MVETIMGRLFAAALALLLLAGASGLAQTPTGPSTPAPADAPDAFGAKVRA